MIIECPQCGFSGRVPERATLAPHQARCPKCRFRFDVGDPDVQRPDPVDGSSLRHDLTRPRLDPSDSSYELNPLDGDFTPVADPWDEDWSEDADAAPARPLLPAASPIAAPRRAPAWVVRALRPSTWRIRLFQAWAVLLLAAALLIVVRTTIAAFSFDDDRFFSNELLRPVASVVLLVCASALLCLYVDVSRSLGRSTYAPRPSPPPQPGPAANAGPPLPPAVGVELARRPGVTRD